jgi:hypothetical protein
MVLNPNNTGLLPTCSWRGQRARGALIAGVVRQLAALATAVVRAGFPRVPRARVRARHIGEDLATMDVATVVADCSRHRAPAVLAARPQRGTSLRCAVEAFTNPSASRLNYPPTPPTWFLHDTALDRGSTTFTESNPSRETRFSFLSSQKHMMQRLIFTDILPPSLHSTPEP